MKRQYTDEEMADIFRDEIIESQLDIVASMTTHNIITLYRVEDLGTDISQVVADRSGRTALEKVRQLIKSIDDEVWNSDAETIMEDHLRDIIDTPEWFTWSVEKINKYLIDVEVEGYMLYLPKMTVTELS